jgi:hypothetical protein
MRNMEDTSAATTPSAAGKDAGGTSKASGSSADERPARESLNTSSDNGISRSSNPNAALPERKPPQPSQDPILRLNVAPKPPPDWDRKEAREERINAVYEADRDDGSRLSEREEARRNRR